MFNLQQFNIFVCPESVVLEEKLLKVHLCYMGPDCVALFKIFR